VYIPSLFEIIITAAMFTFGAAVFALAAKFLPVFPPEEVTETAQS
jgi:Ni/Fe-hydrogenase subunit HybB-like protein